MAAVALLLLGGLWLLMRLYWQGALLVLAAMGLYAVARRRPAVIPAAEPADAAEPEGAPRRAAGGKGKGRKRRR